MQSPSRRLSKTHVETSCRLSEESSGLVCAWLWRDYTLAHIVFSHVGNRVQRGDPNCFSLRALCDRCVGIARNFCRRPELQIITMRTLRTSTAVCTILVFTSACFTARCVQAGKDQ